MRLAFAVWLATALWGGNDSNWDNLHQLRPGEKIEVVDAGMKTHKGEFARYEENELRFTAKTREVTFKREDVIRVSVGEPSRRMRKILLGAAIGGGAMLVASAAANARFANEGHDGFLYPILVPAGLGAGALIGASGSSYRTVYRAAKR